jgi:uracil-DNA glycosylase
MTKLTVLLKEIRACTVCAKDLPLGPRPILAAHESAKIVIVGQAPGRKVHESGIAWHDASGDRLRTWMDIDAKQFYDPKKIAIVPMGFCYPGTGKSGDLPPRPECAPLWHERLLAKLTKVKLTLVVGAYAQNYILGDAGKKNLTETVRSWKEYQSKNIIPLPHPSPRNNIWIRKNEWFEQEVLPVLKRKTKNALRAARRHQ